MDSFGEWLRQVTMVVVGDGGHDGGAAVMDGGDCEGVARAEWRRAAIAVSRADPRASSPACVDTLLQRREK